MSTQSTSKLSAVYLVGALSGALIVAGAATKHDYLFGAGIVVGVVAVVIALARGIQEGAAKAAERQRIWTQGTPGRARVVSLKTTGVRINQDPQVAFDLEVTVPGQEPYPAQVTVMISSLAIPRVQPDCQVDVRVDPQDPKHIVIDPALSP